jgi:carboxyl-terminal processing protease
MLLLIPALFLLVPPAAADDLPEQVQKFMNVYAAIEREAADPVSPEKALYEGAIPGMLRRLDPHSVFFDSGQFEQLKQLQESTRKGFGSVVSVLPGRVIVLQVLPGTPAAKSGIGPGDEIIAINGIGLARLDLDQLVGLLSQARQQQARVEVRRPGNARLLSFALTPEELQSPSVERAFFLRPGIGYLRVSSFDAETGAQVRDTIERLGGRKLKGLVLDFRDNPGGLVTAALDTASLFLKPGQALLSVRGRVVQSKEEKVPETASPYEFPIAVLVNGKTASAAEIVAGGLQDHDRAVVVGEPSYGKGLVESVFPLAEGTGLALTTAYYYTPSGRSVQRPLQGSQIGSSSIANRVDQQREFRTDSGRPVRGGGGIQPDYEVYPEPMSRFRMVLEGTGAFTSFATEYTRAHGQATDSFEVTPAVLDEFQMYLSARNIRPGVGEWSAERGWITNRLKAEIFNQSLGVERGDEVEAQRDPVIVTALEKMQSPVTGQNRKSP